MTLPLRFVLFGLVSLVLGVLALVWRPELLSTYHYNQQIVAVTHLFVLGFVLSVVSGAMYQLVPIVLETTLHSERLARWHFVVHVVSVAGMVAMFWIWNMKQVGHFGSGLALGVGLFVWNIGRTLLRSRGWTVVSFGVASALFWLGAVVAAGLALSAAKSTYELAGRTDVRVTPMLSATLAGLQATQAFLSRFEPLAVMHAHAHSGLLGVFVMVTVAVAYKLVPMFVIGEVQRPWRAWTSLVLLNVGTAGCFGAILVQSVWKPVPALVVLAGLGFYGWEMRAIVRARRRVAIDWGVSTFLVAQSLLAPVGMIGLGLSWPGLTLTEFTGRWETLYGFLAVLGVIGFGILGMLYKIVPFLVWFVAYSGAIGRARTPSLPDMYSARLQGWGCGLWLAGLAVCGGGILAGAASGVRSGAVLLALSLVTFVINTVRVLSHLVRPRLRPLVDGPAMPSSSVAPVASRSETRRDSSPSAVTPTGTGQPISAS